jgi:hypothetical protein
MPARVDKVDKVVRQDKVEAPYRLVEQVALVVVRVRE